MSRRRPPRRGRRRARHPPGSPGSHSSERSAGWSLGRGREASPHLRYRGAMIETFGDSTRDGEWATVRLAVDGETIVEADADGLDRPLAGLTLLEAAAVGGETLAVDALAAALGPVFRAEPRPGRTAVAMSGGVDSAVALLRAGPNAVGVTLRLWLDPNGPDAERACCSPESVIAARETCHRLGLPHVTLDLREEFRRGGRDAVRPRLRARRDAESVHPLQRRLPLRRAARVRAPRRLRPARHRPLRAHRRASRSAAPPSRRRSGEGPVVHARATRSGGARARVVPPRRPGQGGDARGGGARRARGGAAAREPGGVLPRRRRLPRVPRPARARAAGRGDRGRAGPRARPPRGLLAVHAGAAQGDRRPGRAPAVRPRVAMRRRTRSSSARARRSHAGASPRPGGSTPTSTGPR